MMIPMPAMKSGIDSVDVIDANAVGNAVQQITSTKTSQTWLVSQTGPIAWCACSRISFARSPWPPQSCQKPAPKSAPPSTAYAASPTSRRINRASASDIELQWHAAEPPEDPGDGDRQSGIDDGERRVADRDPARTRDG